MTKIGFTNCGYRFVQVFYNNSFFSPSDNSKVIERFFRSGIWLDFARHCLEKRPRYPVKAVGTERKEAVEGIS